MKGMDENLGGPRCVSNGAYAKYELQRGKGRTWDHTMDWMVPGCVGM